MNITMFNTRKTSHNWKVGKFCGDSFNVTLTTYLSAVQIKLQDQGPHVCSYGRQSSVKQDLNIQYVKTKSNNK